MATMNEAQQVLAENISRLRSNPSVAGVATSMLNGDAVILVQLRRRPDPSEWLPTYIGGVRVVARVVGDIQAV